MACGDKYRYLIRTASGRTPDDPCYIHEGLCFPGEYDPWWVAAQNIAGQVKLRWDMLLGAEEAAGNAERSEMIRARVEAYLEVFAALPTSWTGDIWSGDNVLIAKAVTNMEEGVCVMDVLDGAIESLGGKAPEAGGDRPTEPGFFDDLIEAVLVVGLVGTVGAIIWYGVRRQRRRHAAVEAAGSEGY